MLQAELYRLDAVRHEGRDEVVFRGRKIRLASIQTVNIRVQGLRRQDIGADLDHRKFTTVLGHASDDNVPFTIIVGEDELRSQSVKVKDMRRREEKVVAIENLRQFVEASVSGDPR